MQNTNFTIAVYPGDGIGTEIMATAEAVRGERSSIAISPKTGSPASLVAAWPCSALSVWMRSEPLIMSTAPCSTM